MPLHIPRYVYVMQDDPTEHEVTVYPADQTVAEQTAARMMVGSMEDVPMTTAMLWVWAAARRMGHHSLEWPAFHAGLAAFEPVRDPDTGEAEAAELDPTRPGSTDSP